MHVNDMRKLRANICKISNVAQFKNFHVGGENFDFENVPLTNSKTVILKSLEIEIIERYC